MYSILYIFISIYETKRIFEGKRRREERILNKAHTKKMTQNYDEKFERDKNLLH